MYLAFAPDRSGESGSNWENRLAYDLADEFS